MAQPKMIAAVLLIVIFVAMVAYAARTRRSSGAERAPLDRGAELVDDLLQRSLEPGVGFVALVSTEDWAHYHADHQGTLVDVRTSVDARAVDDLVREVTARLRQSPVRSHLLTPSGDVQALVAVDTRRSPFGWKVTMHRVWQGCAASDCGALFRDLAGGA